MISKDDLAKEAIHIEQDIMKEAVGSQDQIWASHGGLNQINFFRDGRFEVSPLILSSKHRKSLGASLMLFFTGFSRYAPLIAQKKIDNFDKKQRELRELQEMSHEAVKILHQDKDPVTELGALIHEAWNLKRQLADGVTTPAVDGIYAAGCEAGALGGKLLGAGGGGFMLFIVKPEDRARVRERLKDLIHVSFEFDTSGSRIIVFEPEGREQRVQ